MSDEDESDLTDGIRGMGVMQETPPAVMAGKQERFMEEIRVAMLAGDHVWIAVVTHRMSSQALLAAKTESLNFDSESVRMVQVGCYVCETPWAEKHARRRCPGEPKGGGPWRGRR